MPPRNRRRDDLVTVPQGYMSELVISDSGTAYTAGTTGNALVWGEYNTTGYRTSLTIAEMVQRDTDASMRELHELWEVGELPAVVGILIEDYGMSDEAINSLFDTWERDGYTPPAIVHEDEDSMPNKIRRYLRGDKVAGVDDDVVKGYYDAEKKKRYLNRDERSVLHKPIKDGDKPTSSIKLDDLVPAD